MASFLTIPSRLSRNLAGVSILILLLTPKALEAQTPEEKEAQRSAAEAAEREKAAEEAARAAEEAERLKALEEEPEVTLEQAAAEPNNIELNYRYARGQARRGNLKEAAQTLERILRLDPSLPKVRLFYAIVLFRLDSLEDAERQLNILRDLPMKDTLRAELDQYLRAIERRRARTHFSGRFSVGFQYDSNRNAAPASGERLLADAPIGLSGTSLRREDTSILSIASLELRRDMGEQRRHQLFGSYTYYRADQTVVKTLELQAHSLETGGLVRTPWFELTPSLLFDHVFLARETFLRNRGGALRLERRMGRTASFYAEARNVYQDYVATALVPTGEEYTGVQVEGTLGMDALVSPAMKVGGALTYTAKHARQRFNAFQRYSLELSHTWVLGRGMFLLSSLSANEDQYDQPDPAISVKYRRDRTLRARATVGTSLGLLLPALRDFVWSLTYEYYHAFSTVTNYAYSNNKIATLLTFRWDKALILKLR